MLPYECAHSSYVFCDVFTEESYSLLARTISCVDMNGPGILSYVCAFLDCSPGPNALGELSALKMTRDSRRGGRIGCNAASTVHVYHCVELSILFHR